jgi:phage-related protein
MAGATSVIINIGAATAGAVREINKVGGALQNQLTAGEKFKKGMKAAAVPAGLAFAAISAGAVKAVKGAEEAASATAALNTVYESMGYGELAAGANAYADSLERTIGVEAETIKAAQTKLATFEDVAKNAKLMERATLSAADLSAAGFGDMSTVANGLGKALQDPVKGMSLLTKQGSLTKAEQEKIAKAFEKTGDKAAAQDSILAALEKQTGGVAESTANTSDKMSLAFGAVSDAVGAALLPAMESLMPYIEGFADWATNNSGTLTVIAGVIGVLAAAVIAVNVAMAVWSAVAAIATGVTTAFGIAMTVLTSPIFLIVAAIAAVIAIGVLLYKNWDTIKGWLSTAWNAIKSTATSVWNSIKGFFVSAWNSIKSKAVEIFNGLKTAVTDAITAVYNFVKKIPSKIVSAIGNVARTLYTKGKDLITGLIDGYMSMWAKVLSFAGDIGSKILRAIGNVARTLYEKGKSLIQGFIDGIKSMAGAILNAIIGILPGPVRGIIQGALGLRAAAPAGRSARASSTSNVFHLHGGSTADDARTIKRILEGGDIRQGRRPGTALRVAW